MKKTKYHLYPFLLLFHCLCFFLIIVTSQSYPFYQYDQQCTVNNSQLPYHQWKQMEKLLLDTIKTQERLPLNQTKNDIQIKSNNYTKSYWNNLQWFITHLPIQLIKIGYIYKCFSEAVYQSIKQTFEQYQIQDKQDKKQEGLMLEDNFANIYGGAKILMKSSQNIKSAQSILEDNPDRYLYCDEKLPISMVFALNQQIAIDSIAVISSEMYSSIIKQFKIQASITFYNATWVQIGTFKAKDSFQEQKFVTDKMIARYIRITILSVYGRWSYFTLTQIKVFGRGLFADAVSTQKIQRSKQKTQRNKQGINKVNQQQSTCQNQFKEYLHEVEITSLHSDNILTKLMDKIQSLQERNYAQNEKILELAKSIKEMNNHQKQDILPSSLNESDSILPTSISVSILALNGRHFNIFLIVLTGIVGVCIIFRCIYQNKLKPIQKSKRKK